MKKAIPERVKSNMRVESFYEKMKRNRLKNLTRKFDSLFVLTK